jgi:hypothetical protein
VQQEALKLQHKMSHAWRDMDRLATHEAQSRSNRLNPRNAGETTCASRRPRDTVLRGETIAWTYSADI